MQLSIIGIDLDETSCSLIGVDAAGKVVVRRRMHRDIVVSCCSKYISSIVAMESLLRPPPHRPCSSILRS